MSELFIVSTPIGNLSDITLRALETLKSVDIIASEDTRNTKTLLEKYNIKTRLISYHKFSEVDKRDTILKYLKENKNVALVTDAGTPLISDPGNVLVKAAYKNNIKITPICGACAVITLIQSISRADEDFKFIGFLPKVKNQIEEIFKNNKGENLVFYESPKRILKTFEIIKNIDSNIQVSIGRELTKKFEEILTDNVDKIYNHFKNKEIKGEFVVLVHKSKDEKDENEILSDINFLKKLNISNKNISEILSKLKKYNKNSVYKLTLK